MRFFLSWGKRSERQDHAFVPFDERRVPCAYKVIDPIEVVDEIVSGPDIIGVEVAVAYVSVHRLGDRVAEAVDASLIEAYLRGEEIHDGFGQVLSEEDLDVVIHHV